MRKDALLYVADAIEKHTVPDLGFNMGAFMSSDQLEVDLSDEQAQDLFYFSGVGHLIWDVPPSEAVAELRRLAATCDTEA
jgi:hypothetical protein